ncbi:unnamed protein product [Symbiodinium pilosum]|uniref:Uncharacterized protein n=1 Tax=Symbiodinium pilosum TaxID=2952 RepID=A0A812T118_SYMPI|nr:unnamed protein product [Symbiodinium pilosum]
MCKCGKTCSRVSVGVGLLLTIAGIALLLVGAMGLSSLSINVSADIDGGMTGMLSSDGVSRAPAQRTLNDLDWTIGASETKLTDLKLAAQVTFTQEGDASITSAEGMWSMQLCEVFEEVFAVAGRSIIMIACGTPSMNCCVDACTLVGK